MFNASYLSERLKEAGFLEVREWDPRHVENHDFDDWASMHIERGGKRFDISLNVEATKAI